MWWVWFEGYMCQENVCYKVVVIDFGVKCNILCLFVLVGCDVIVLLVIVIVEEIFVYSFDGVFLLNGSGDFVVIGEYVVLMI